MSEIAPAGGGGPNRLFVVLALGLAGLLVLGLIAIGGVLLIPRLLGGAAAPTTVRAATTPTRIIVLATLPPSPTVAATETGASTPTLVNAAPGAGTPGAEGTATPTVIGGGGTPSTTGTPGAGGALPSTGMGENLLLLAGGVVLVLIAFVARRARAA